ncbi:galactokinase [Streptomyces sp. DSM 41527]|uniref:Galactokinase n=1 Tax=Streptomyces mooreae TaxID=3075523 RepID=A0ABU2TJE3_9ACTN|nr:galactokinase [Streptomyces sp. DSM 41527]MDT0461073.1 galactokinase [Streptomyces sp. DSM 41527]
MSAVDLARRTTADPLLRLLSHGFSMGFHRPPDAVWRAPYAFRVSARAVRGSAAALRGSPTSALRGSASGFQLPASAVPPGPAGTGPTRGADWFAAAGHYVDVAVAPRADGMLRCASLNHPAETAELPLTGPAARAPAWAARPYAVLRGLAAAGCGRGGADLQLNAPLPEAVGLPVAEPLECAVALAVSGVHAGRGGDPPTRPQLARLLASAVPGDDGLRRAVLFARSGHTLAADGHTHLPLRAPDGGTDACLLLLTARPAAIHDADTGDTTPAVTATPDTPTTRTATGLATAVHEALRAGAWSAWWPGTRPGRGVLLLVPPDRRVAVRTATAEAFRRCDLPVPRLLRINVVDAARREA